MPAARYALASPVLLLVALALLALAGCGSSSTGTSAGTTPPPSNVQALCQALPAFKSTAGNPAAAAGFKDLTFPSGALSTTLSSSSPAAGSYGVSTASFCAAGTPDDISAFYGGALGGNGWVQDTLFPADAKGFHACGDATTCWHKNADSPPFTFVALDQVTAHGGVSSFRLRFARAPSYSACASVPDYPSPIYGSPILQDAPTYPKAVYIGVSGSAGSSSSYSFDNTFWCGAHNGGEILNYYVTT